MFGPRMSTEILLSFEFLLTHKTGEFWILSALQADMTRGGFLALVQFSAAQAFEFIFAICLNRSYERPAVLVVNEFHGTN